MKAWGVLTLVGIVGLFTTASSEEADLTGKQENKEGETAPNATFLSIGEETNTIENNGTGFTTEAALEQSPSTEATLKTGAEYDGSKGLKKAGGVLGSYLAGIGSESLANNADKIKPPPASITRRPAPLPPPLNIGSVWNKNKNIGVNGHIINGGGNGDIINGGGNGHFINGGGPASQGQNGVRRRRPRPPQQVPPPSPSYGTQDPDYYDLPKQRPFQPQRPQLPAQGGGGYRPSAPADAIQQPQFLPPKPPAQVSHSPPPRPVKPLTEEQKLAYHYLQLLEEKEKQQEGGQAQGPQPQTFVPRTTRPQLPPLVEVATTPEYDDYDPDYPDRPRTTTATTVQPTRRRRRRTTTGSPQQAPYQQQQQQNFYPPQQQPQQQPAYNPYFPPPQQQAPIQPPAYYPPSHQAPQPPPYVPPPQSPYTQPLTPAQFQQLQQQQQHQPIYAPPPQYQQQPIYPPAPQQPYYPNPQQPPAYPQAQPGYPPPALPPYSQVPQPQQQGYPGPPNPILSQQVPATTPLEDYDYVDTPTKPTPPTTLRPVQGGLATSAPDVNNLQYQQFLQFQRLQQLKLLIELQRLRAQSESTTHSGQPLNLNPGDATTTEDPYVYVPRLFINPYIAPTKLTTTTDNPSDVVQDLSNFFGSLAVGNLAGVVDGGLKFAGTGVLDNLNTFVACQMQGKCGEEPAGGETNTNPYGSVGGSALGGNGQLVAKTDKYSYIPHQQHPYPGQRPPLD